jgi:hypothetical protein
VKERRIEAAQTLFIRSLVKATIKDHAHNEEIQQPGENNNKIQEIGKCRHNQKGHVEQMSAGRLPKYRWNTDTENKEIWENIKEGRGIKSVLAFKAI